MDPKAPSYIERAADAELLAALLRGEYVFLLDSRQKGKSSMVARTIVKLREANVATVKLDLQRIGANVTPEQWYAGLLAEIGQELGATKALFEYWEERQPVGPLARFVGALQEVVLDATHKPIVVFIDEIDFVRALPFPTDEFFAGIRDCYNRRSEVEGFRRLTFCLVGVATPGQLIRNPEITPFNIGTRIDLSDFTLEEVKGYAAVLDSEARKGGTLMSRVHYWLNGHPYLTQLLCSHIAEDRSLRSPHDVDRLVKRLFFSPEARQREPNFADVERRILDPDVPGLTPEEKRTQVLELYGRILKGKKVVAGEENPVVATLRLSGVGLEDKQALRVRNRLYGLVFNENWRRSSLPEAEMRRQRGAARVALLRTAAVAGVVVLGVTGVALNTQKLSSDRKIALQNLRKRTNELVTTAEQRKQALNTINERNRDLTVVSNERKTALTLAERRAKELAKVSRQRQATIRDLERASEELDKQQYFTTIGSLNYAANSGDSIHTMMLSEKLNGMKRQSWERGYIERLTHEVDYKAQLSMRTSFEYDEKGNLYAASPFGLYLVGREKITKVRAFKQTLADELKRAAPGLDKPTWAFPDGFHPRLGTGPARYRYWWDNVHLASCVLDAQTEQIIARLDPRPLLGTAWNESAFLQRHHDPKEPDKLELISLPDSKVVKTITVGPGAASAIPRSNGNWILLFTDKEGDCELRLYDSDFKVIKVVSAGPPKRFAFGLQKFALLEDRIGKYFALEGETEIQVRRCEDLSLISIIRNIPPDTSQADFSGDDSLIAVGRRTQGSINVYDVASGRLVRTLIGHKSLVMALGFLPDGRIASVDNAGELLVWSRVPSHAEIAATSIASRPTHTADGKYRIWLTRTSLYSYQRETGKLTRLDPPTPIYLPSLTETKYVFVGNSDGTLSKVDPATLRTLSSVRLEKVGRVFMMVPAGGKIFLAWVSRPEDYSDPTRRYCLVNAETMQVVSRFEIPVANFPNQPRTFSLTFDRSQKYIGFFQMGSKEITTVDLQTGKIVKRWNAGRRVFAIRLMPDASCIAANLGSSFTSQDAEVVLFDPATGRRIGTVGDKGGYIEFMSFSKDSRLLVTPRAVWDMKTKKMRFSLKGVDVRNFMFSPDLTKLATIGANPNSFTLWDVESGTATLSLPFESDFDTNTVNYVMPAPEFSPDGTELCLNFGDGVLRIWRSKALKRK